MDMGTSDIYEIRVKGAVDERWVDWYGDMNVSPNHLGQSQVTTLTGRVTDQSALRGILTALWDLNLALISVNLIE